MLIRALEGRRILLVDSDESLLSLIRDVLEDEGADVCACTSVEGALALIARAPFDAVISAVRLCGGGGAELYRAILATRAELADRMLFLTGDPYGSDARALASGSGRPVLGKPLPLQILIDEVGRLFVGPR